MLFRSAVEAAIGAHPRVMMAAVVGIADATCGEYVHAEIVLRPGESIDYDELREFLDGRLSDNDLPRTIGIAPSLPLTAVGKVLRRVVRETCQRKNDAS